MKKIINTIVTIGYWVLATRGAFAVVDDLCKFIDKRVEIKAAMEVKKRDDTVDEHVCSTVDAS